MVMELIYTGKLIRSFSDDTVSQLTAHNILYRSHTGSVFKILYSMKQRYGHRTRIPSKALYKRYTKY